MINVAELIITVICSVLASSGLWTFILKRAERKDARTKMILGLAHEKIVAMGMQYVARGYILQDEYDDLNGYLWEPYRDLGGNGSAERVVKEVDKLPMFRTHLEAQKALHDKGD